MRIYLGKDRVLCIKHKNPTPVSNGKQAELLNNTTNMMILSIIIILLGINYFILFHKKTQDTLHPKTTLLSFEIILKSKS